MLSDFFTLIQVFDGPERYGAFSFFETIPSSPRLHAASKQFVTVALSLFDVLDAATVPQKFSQCRFAFHIGPSPEILSIVHQKVESAGTRVLIAHSTMQRIELRHAIPVEPNDFGVKNG